MTTLLEKAVHHLRDQLDWRTQGGKPMAVITLTHDEATLICAELASRLREALSLRGEPAGKPGQPGASEDNPLPETSPRGS